MSTSPKSECKLGGESWGAAEEKFAAIFARFEGRVFDRTVMKEILEIVATTYGATDATEPTGHSREGLCMSDNSTRQS